MEKTESDYWISRWSGHVPIDPPECLRGYVPMPEKKVKKSVVDKILSYLQWKPSTDKQE